MDDKRNEETMAPQNETVAAEQSATSTDTATMEKPIGSQDEENIEDDDDDDDA